jgi:hypothetical protein
MSSLYAKETIAERAIRCDGKDKQKRESDCEKMYSIPCRFLKQIVCCCVSYFEGNLNRRPGPSRRRDTQEVYLMKTGLFVRSRRAAAFLLTATLAVTLSFTVEVQAQQARSIKAADRDPLVDSVADGRGRINFNQGVVKATGYGAPRPRHSPV